MKTLTITLLTLLTTSLWAKNRDDWQKPQKIFKAMSDNKSSKVYCEVGAGEGYFAFKAAKQFKHVYATEVSDDKVKHLKVETSKLALKNVTIIKSTYTASKLPLKKCDVIFMGMVYHHIEGRIAYLKDLKKHLSPRGEFVNLDNVIEEKKYYGSGRRLPDMSCRFAKSQFLKEAKQAGYHVTYELQVLPTQYLVRLSL
jgi:ubiquinone/menaquinone biosynthesis C-methylase UbiE